MGQPHPWPLAHPPLSYNVTQADRYPRSTHGITYRHPASLAHSVPPPGRQALWLVPTQPAECLSGEFAQQQGQRHIKDSLPGCSQPSSAFLLEDSVGSLHPETQLCKTTGPLPGLCPHPPSKPPLAPRQELFLHLLPRPFQTSSSSRPEPRGVSGWGEVWQSCLTLLSQLPPSTDG